MNYPKQDEWEVKPTHSNKYSNDRTFVLNWDSNVHAAKAMWTYATSICPENPEMAEEIFACIRNNWDLEQLELIPYQYI
jgi:hypothetical protein